MIRGGGSLVRGRNVVIVEEDVLVREARVVGGIGLASISERVGAPNICYCMRSGEITCRGDIALIKGLSSDL